MEFKVRGLVRVGRCGRQCERDRVVRGLPDKQKLEYFRNLLLERRHATEVLRHKEETLSPSRSLD